MAVVACAALCACATQATRRDADAGGPTATEVAAAERAITVAALTAPIRFLADDALEGRGPGTRGDALARLYVATSLQGLGLEPAFPGGLWEQPVDLLGVTTRAPARWTFARGGARTTLARGDDFVAAIGPAREHAAVDDAELVFVGYGIDAPEYGWDDFKGADLRGKILLVLNDDPDWEPELFAGKRRLYYGRWTYKYESAARQGAVGAIVIHTPESAGYPWQTVQTSFSGESSRLADAPGGRGLEVEAWVTEEAARRIVALAGRDLDQLTAAARSRSFAPVPLGSSTSLRLTSAIRRYQTANVAAVLRGRDPTLRDQHVVYTAHLDHLGTVPGEDGVPRIHNGALDNAAGVSQVLAVARAFSALPVPPRRSVLFVALAAEEQGLLGAERFVRDPPVPVAALAANLNVDGGNVLGRARDVAVIGLGKSTLDRFVREAATRQQRAVTDDPFPDRGLFYRSDQLRFAQAGVPALLLGQSVDYVGRGEGWGRGQVDAWNERHYHQPSDDFDTTWDLAGMVEDARLLFRTGWGIAEAERAPEWRAGDEFARLRPPSAPLSSEP